MSEKEQVIQALRATLISVKGALTLKQCNRDYKELQGEWIPYKKIGYPTLEKLFQEVPGFKIKEINGEWYVDAIASQETQHIASMVARQKSNKKPAKLSTPSRFPKTKQGSWRKPSSLTSYDNQYSKQYYRAKTNTSHNNNNNGYNGKANMNKYYKSNDAKLNTYPNTKQTVTKSNEIVENVAGNIKNSSSSQAARNFYGEEFQTKHSTKNEKKTEINSSNKISASQRLSNFRDRLNTVDVMIPLQLPAHDNELYDKSGYKKNADPVSYAVPAYNLEPPPDTTSSIIKLEWTCKKLGLPLPVYKTQDCRPTNGPVTYDCTVRVGSSYKASSYPNSSPTEELAKEVASEKLLHIIQSSEASGLPTSSNSKAISGLTELVSEHEAGVWANTVPCLYREKYKENLPKNWLELIETCPLIKKEKVVNGLLVLLLNIEDRSNVTLMENLILDDTIDSDLPPLQFPEDDFWNVYITVANSTIEIWLRIIGVQYSDAFENLLADMTQYYDYSGATVDKSMLIVNAWYAVNLDDGGWQRAKVLEIYDDTASVFLGDHGDDDIVVLDNIKILEPQFRRLPAQAILCRLEGAEELSETEIGAELVARRLPGEVLVAAPGPRTDPTDPSVSVVLFDTSTQRDLNLNKEIIHDFCIAGAFNITQKLCEVEVRCVTDEGRVWVSRAGGADLVRKALALLTAGPFRRPLPAAPQAPPPQAGTLYIVRTIAGDWVRCTIISGLDGEGTVRTQLVDSGQILRAPLSSLIPLQTFSQALNEYPYQAMQVRLGPAAESVASSMVDRLRDLLLGERVLCRAAASSPAFVSTSAPHVELYVRPGPQTPLVPVNHSIVGEYEYLQLSKSQEAVKEKEPTSHVEALNKKKERLYRTGSSGGVTAPPVDKSRPLPPPVLPYVGQCIDVRISIAANPWNFVIQPNRSRLTLKEMMASLQEECPKIPEEDAPVNPVSGELYTAYYDKDSSWYRVTVANSVSSELLSVYFCDFGDLAVCSKRVLRPVPASVPLARTLPPQAIKARLYDVWPLHQDWSVEDCIRFQELCVEQEFVAVCKEVGKDPLNPSETLLTLDLIDTSTDEDIYLNKQLVAEERARLGSASIPDN
ncbi:unnamed protein product [Leptosia nina]|uniref:Tudor domain-containing protein 7 n=1 Tax=Leptosia nina TaxID=320188 RepID=A0AAV1IW14_9NEOP